MHHYFQTCNQNCSLILTNALALEPEVVNAPSSSLEVGFVLGIKYGKVLMLPTFLFIIVVVIVAQAPTVGGVSTRCLALILVTYLRLIPGAVVKGILGL